MTTKKPAAKTLEERLAERVKENLTPRDMDEAYREMLDEVYSFASVGGIFANMSPARVMHAMDETAYRCGFNDWIDGELGETVEAVPEGSEDYYDKREVSDLRDEIQDEIDAEEEKAAA